MGNNEGHMSKSDRIALLVQAALHGLNRSVGIKATSPDLKDGIAVAKDEDGRMFKIEISQVGGPAD